MVVFWSITWWQDSCRGLLDVSNNYVATLPTPLYMPTMPFAALCLAHLYTAYPAKAMMLIYPPRQHWIYSITHFVCVVWCTCIPACSAKAMKQTMPCMPLPATPANNATVACSIIMNAGKWWTKKKVCKEERSEQGERWNRDKRFIIKINKPTM